MSSIIDAKEKIDLGRPLTTKMRSFKLQFRYLNRFNTAGGAVKEKSFWFTGNLKEATIRARKHCEIMGYTYIFCMPDIVDLDAQEELKLKHETDEYDDQG